MKGQVLYTLGLEAVVGPMPAPEEGKTSPLTTNVTNDVTYSAAHGGCVAVSIYGRPVVVVYAIIPDASDKKVHTLSFNNYSTDQFALIKIPRNIAVNNSKLPTIIDRTQLLEIQVLTIMF